MDLSQHFRRAQRLSPKAAQLAARLLAKATDVPNEWQFSLQMILAERAASSLPLSTTDLMALSDPEMLAPRAQPNPFYSEDRAAALSYVKNVRQSSQAR